jgi:hypothetical protein
VLCVGWLVLSPCCVCGASPDAFYGLQFVRDAVMPRLHGPFSQLIFADPTQQENGHTRTIRPLLPVRQFPTQSNCDRDPLPAGMLSLVHSSCTFHRCRGDTSPLSATVSAGPVCLPSLHAGSPTKCDCGNSCSCGEGCKCASCHKA